MFNVFMKKTLSIMILSLLLGGNAYAETKFIKCNSDKNASYQRSYIFEINDRKKDIKLVQGLGVNENKKTIKEFSKNYIDIEYDGIITYSLDKDNKLIPNEEQYVHITISRITGEMHYLMNERNNMDKLLSMENFTCKKAEPIF